MKSLEQTNERRRSENSAAQEFYQIQKFAAACRRQWPGAKIVLRPNESGPPLGAGAPLNSESAPGASIMQFDDHDTPSEADLDLCYGSKFLSATELGDKKIRARILKVKKEPLRGQDGKEKYKFMLSFSNLDKSLVANATNIKTLVDALGKDPRGWLNAEVGIFTEPTMMAGKPTRGVRLRVLGKPPAAAPAHAPAPKPSAPAPTAKDAAPWPDEPGDIAVRMARRLSGTLEQKCSRRAMRHRRRGGSLCRPQFWSAGGADLDRHRHHGGGIQRRRGQRYGGLTRR
jgi:hypothetical protein